MKLLKISGVLLYLFCMVLAIMLYFNYVFTPLNSKIDLLDKEHTADTAQMHSYDQQILKMNDLQSKIAKMQSQLKQETTATTVTGKNVAEDIGAACTSAGIVPQAITVADEVIDKTKTSVTKKPLCSVIIDLQTNCTDTQLQGLLSYFENLSKGAYYVNTITDTKGKDKSVVNLSLTLYYFSSEGIKG